MDYSNPIDNLLATLKEDGNYRHFLTIEKNSAKLPHFNFENHLGEKKEAVNWCSNDYLGMSINPQVIDRYISVAKIAGVGSGGTRNISGTTIYHKELEEDLAALHEKEAALIFGGAYLANLTSLYTLGKIFPEAIYISDEYNHASLIEGIRASGCKKHIFKHNDLESLEHILKRLPADVLKIIVFESVYSISGTISPVVEIISLARKYSCLTYLDEVHAVGLYGHAGAGMASEKSVAHEIDIINGTLAKGFGTYGGYIVGKRNMLDAIRSFGSGFIFTTSLPPAVCAAASESIRITSQSNELRILLHENVKKLRDLFKENGINYNHNPSHITPIPIGDSRRCKIISDCLLNDHGVYLQPINYPTVPRSKECLRIVATPKHKYADMVHLAKSLYQEVYSNQHK